MDLVIAGWKPGLKAISLMDILRKFCGMGLRQSKEAVDGLLNGRAILLSGLKDEVADAVRKEVEAIGAVCQ